MEEIILNSHEKAEKILFIFHGYGADNENMRFLGEVFAKAFPKIEVHIPNAPNECEENYGRQWFSLAEDDVEIWRRSCSEKIPEIIKYITTVLEKKKLSLKETVLAGFSQGAMVALRLGVEYNVLGAISFAGILLPPSEQLLTSPTTKFFLAQGERDQVVSFLHFKLTKDSLLELGAHVESAISPNIAHEIDNYLLMQAVDFFKKL
jgi:phospholipase/carboxylesterase